MSGDTDEPAPSLGITAGEAPAEQEGGRRLPELPIDPTAAERSEHERARDAGMDATLRRAYDRAQARTERAERNNPKPPLPHYPEDMPSDARTTAALNAHVDWYKLPLAERQQLAAAHKRLGDLVDSAKSYGIKVESAADFAALRQLLGGGDEAAPPAQPDPAVERSLGVLNKLAPGAKSHAEAAQTIDHWSRHIESNGPQGWRDLLGSYGVSPAQMLTQGEAAQVAARFHGVPLEDVARMAGIGAQDRETTIRQSTGQAIDDFARSKPDMDAALRYRMGEMILSGKISLEGGRYAALERAYNEAKRRPRGRPRSKMDAGLQDIAARRYGTA